MFSPILKGQYILHAGPPSNWVSSLASTLLQVYNPPFFNVIDSFGVEVIHPAQEARSTQSQRVSRKGKSNRRWIVGRKTNVTMNGELEIVDYQENTANVCDNTFDEPFTEKQEQIYLTDKGYRKQELYGGTPPTFKICASGTWNERMWIERLFSLWTRICGMKHSFHRSVKGFQAKLAYLVALTNIVFRLNESLGFHKCSLAQWAL